MTKRTFFLSAALGLGLALSGCGEKSTSDVAPKSTEPAATEKATDASLAAPTLNVEDASSPEGVVEAFFRSFFKGDDEGAFALLTSKAQTATREQFSAQASDTIKWAITKKTAPENGRVLVFVSVEDYTDSGEIQTEELTFALSDADSVWRVAGFSVGGVAINFEDRQINALVQENESEPQASETNVKVGQNADGVVR